jgi:hypothetical protein
LGSPEPRTPAGAHFDEDKLAAITGHDVHFAPTATVLGIENPVPFAFEEAAGNSFSPVA